MGFSCNDALFLRLWYFFCLNLQQLLPRAMRQIQNSKPVGCETKQNDGLRPNSYMEPRKTAKSDTIHFVMWTGSLVIKPRGHLIHHLCKNID